VLILKHVLLDSHAIIRKRFVLELHVSNLHALMINVVIHNSNLVNLAIQSVMRVINVVPLLVNGYVVLVMAILSRVLDRNKDLSDKLVQNAAIRSLNLVNTPIPCVMRVINVVPLLVNGYVVSVMAILSHVLGMNKDLSDKLVHAVTQHLNLANLAIQSVMRVINVVQLLANGYVVLVMVLHSCHALAMNKDLSA